MYYPKSQILENQYANPGELYDSSTGKEYVGPYYKTSDNSYFTGKNPQDLPNNELKTVKPPEKSTDSEPLPESYYIINNEYYYAKGYGLNRIAPRPPKSTFPTPTESDYTTGEFNRYFLKKSNESIYLEVSQDEYELFKQRDLAVQYDNYVPLFLNWQLTGKLKEVYQTNLKLVGLSEQRNNIFGFVKYFKGRFSQFFRYTPGENLYTDGSEFKNQSTGELYIGLYHVHPSKGPMVGATHVSSPHDYLIPLSGSFEQIETEIARQPVTYRRGGGSSGGY